MKQSAQQACNVSKILSHHAHHPETHYEVKLAAPVQMTSKKSFGQKGLLNTHRTLMALHMSTLFTAICGTPSLLNPPPERVTHMYKADESSKNCCNLNKAGVSTCLRRGSAGKKRMVPAPSTVMGAVTCARAHTAYFAARRDSAGHDVSSRARIVAKRC